MKSFGRFLNVTATIRVSLLLLVVNSSVCDGLSIPPSIERRRNFGSTAGKTLGVAPDANLLGEAWTAYNAALETSPLITKSVTAGAILGAADLAGQTIESKIKEEKTEIDAGRFVRFAVFGLVLQAPWNHFYYQFLDGALPPTEDPLSTTTGVKVIIDQFVQAPIFTVLIFLFLGTLEGKSLDQVKAQLDDNYSDTMVANWKLWVPATMVNIAFCPPVLRVLFLNVVFFFWSIFLSLKLNSSSEVSSEE